MGILPFYPVFTQIMRRYTGSNWGMALGRFSSIGAIVSAYLSCSVHYLVDFIPRKIWLKLDTLSVELQAPGK
jgi:hypothetical protein